MRRALPCLAAIFVSMHAADAAEASDFPSVETAQIRVADGFDFPVGRDGSKNYYVARGFRVNGHLGEDWNGQGGGDTDLGDPVYCTAHGLVVFAQDYKMGWGNVIIVRHAYYERGKLNYVDSLYGHLHQILVRNGQHVVRGQKIGTIGNNHGQYDAHLHFEIRKNLTVGMYRSSFPRDTTVYHLPTPFVNARRKLEGGGQIASAPINTFPAEPPPVLAGPREYTPTVTFSAAKTQILTDKGIVTRDGGGNAKAARSSGASPIRPRGGGFRVDRYDDIRPGSVQ
jgi:hypothetical protein